MKMLFFVISKIEFIQLYHFQDLYNKTVRFPLTISRDEILITVTNLQFFQLRSRRAFTKTISQQGRYPVPRDAQQAEIAEDLQCFTRKFFQIAVYYIKLLKSSVHAKKTVLFDQSQWRIDKFEYSHIQWIQSGPVESYCQLIKME